MHARPAPRATRWVRLVLCAAGLALGGSAVSLALGLDATPSYAAPPESGVATSSDDRAHEDHSLLGAALATVDEIAEVLPDAAAAPVTRAVGAVTDTATKAVRTVARSVDAAAASKPIAKITSKVSKTVSSVPVVGRIEAGVSATAEGLGKTVTSATERVVAVGYATVDALVPADPPLPPLPGSPDEPTAPTQPATAGPGELDPPGYEIDGDTPSPGVGATAAARFPDTMLRHPGVTAAQNAAPETMAAADGSRQPGPRHPDALPPLAPAGTASGASHGTNGAVSGAAATLSERPPALTPGSRTPLPGNEEAPPGRAPSPDTSPD